MNPNPFPAPPPLIDAANLFQTKRHYARVVNGLGAGVSLCTEGLAVAVEVYDREGLARANPANSRRGGPKDIAGLPLCRHCAAKAGRAA